MSNIEFFESCLPLNRVYMIYFQFLSQQVLKSTAERSELQSEEEEKEIKAAKGRGKAQIPKSTISITVCIRNMNGWNMMRVFLSNLSYQMLTNSQTRSMC